jgi:hypothetical protein
MSAEFITADVLGLVTKIILPPSIEVYLDPIDNNEQIKNVAKSDPMVD